MREEELPDDEGHFGPYGGRFDADTLTEALKELHRAYLQHRSDPVFLAEFAAELHDYVGRATPLYHAERLTALAGGAQIFFKREDLNHTGAHKINNAVGQALLAKRMGKKRIIAATGAGQHGVASATVAAKLGLECVVYIGTEDIKHRAANVYRIKLLGAVVEAVNTGLKTLKEAQHEAMRDWVSRVDDTYYLMGSVAGPHPYPQLVRDFQSVIGQESRAQMYEKTGRLPEALIAFVGGGSSAMGLFHPFLQDDSVRFYGVEAVGTGADTAVHDYLKDIARIEYVSINDDDAVAAFRTLSRVEGIIPALEPSYAIAYAMKRARDMSNQEQIIVNLSARSDKDIDTVANRDGVTLG